MLLRKTLSDLIEPYEFRKQQLAAFICDVAHFRPYEEKYALFGMCLIMS